MNEAFLNLAKEIRTVEGLTLQEYIEPTLERLLIENRSNLPFDLTGIADEDLYDVVVGYRDGKDSYSHHPDQDPNEDAPLCYTTFRPGLASSLCPVFEVTTPLYEDPWEMKYPVVHVKFSVARICDVLGSKMSETTSEAIEALFTELWPSAKPAQKDRKFKQDAMGKGHGFPEFGFYREINRWLVYKKNGIAENSPIEWRALSSAQGKKVSALFPTKKQGGRRNAT